MAVRLKWPILGIIIPVILISVLSYASHIFILRYYLSITEQVVYQIYVMMIWVSYYLAIVKSPGESPKNYKPPRGEWARWCKSCEKYKPPRTHHCKTCNMCVLYMDHHCPWTLNCVGLENLPHFMRFLTWVIWGTGYLSLQLWKRIYSYYEQSDLPIYLIRKSEMIAVIFLTPLNLFVFVSISVLFIRCLINICKGMTQIETWEWDRIDSQFYSNRLWSQIRRNYELLHGKELPKLSTWTNGNEDEIDRDLDQDQVPKNFTMDDVIFPYDLGVWGNIVNFLNYPWLWLYPFSKPLADGVDPKISLEYKQDDQLNLPWPPDGNNQDITVHAMDDEQLRKVKNYKELKQRLDPKSNLNRTEWTNEYGENLDDLNVVDSDEYILVK